MNQNQHFKMNKIHVKSKFLYSSKNEQKNLFKYVTYHIKICQGKNCFQFLSLSAILNSLNYQVNATGDVLLVQQVQVILFLLGCPGCYPFLPERFIAQIFRVHIHHTTARDCSRRGILKVIHLEENSLRIKKKTKQS